MLTPYFMTHLTSVASFTWDDLVELSSDPTSFKLIAPPTSTTRDLPATKLPRVVENVNTFCDVMIKQCLLTFFEGRASPVMVCSCDMSSPAALAPVVKPDGEIYKVDIQPLLRWYIVLRGRNVGVVQGECVILAPSCQSNADFDLYVSNVAKEWTEGVPNARKWRASSEEEACTRFMEELRAGSVSIAP
jgi:hypothetical protein